MHTVAHNTRITVLHFAEQGWPFVQVVEVEAKIIVLRKRIKVSLIEVQEVQRGHALNGSHGDIRLNVLLRSPCASMWWGLEASSFFAEYNGGEYHGGGEDVACHRLAIVHVTVMMEGPMTNPGSC